MLSVYKKGNSDATAKGVVASDSEAIHT